MPVTAPWSKVICPYCFERFHLSQAPLRLDGPGSPTEPDPKIATHFGMPSPPVYGKIIPPAGAGKWWRRAYLPREATNQRRVCPACHIYLPDKIASGEAPSEVIAVVGLRNSGKSVYFGVLMNILRRRYMQEVGFDLIDAETFGVRGRLATDDLYRDRYHKFLFDPNNPRVMDQTRPIQGAAVSGNDDPRTPLIYMFRFKKRWWHYLTRPLAHLIPVYLMIYDSSGEDLPNQATLEHNYKFLHQATGIIFMIDPFDYPGIRSQLPEDVRKELPPPMPSPAQVVDNVIKLFQRNRSAAGKINVPVAFTLTKSDMFDHIGKLIHKASPLSGESDHDSGFDRAGCEELNRELVQRIREWDSPELTSKADNNFSNYQFFALSALGARTATNKKLTRAITPRRIADPLLWLFWKRGYLPETLSSRKLKKGSSRRPAWQGGFSSSLR